MRKIYYEWRCSIIDKQIEDEILKVKNQDIAPHYERERAVYVRGFEDGMRHLKNLIMKKEIVKHLQDHRLNVTPMIYKAMGR